MDIHHQRRLVHHHYHHHHHCLLIEFTSQCRRRCCKHLSGLTLRRVRLGVRLRVAFHFMAIAIAMTVNHTHSHTHTHTVKTRIVPRLGKHPRATRWMGVRGGGGVKCNFKWSPNGQLFTVVALFACLPIVGVCRPLLLLPLRTINFNCCLTRCWVIKLYFNTANRSTNVLNSQEETKVHKVLSFHRFIYYSTLIYSFIYE